MQILNCCGSFAFEAQVGFFHPGEKALGELTAEFQKPLDDSYEVIVCRGLSHGFRPTSRLRQHR